MEWSNYHPGSKIMFEQLNINLGKHVFGLFAVHFHYGS
jgi:hypothetical protein